MSVRRGPARPAGQPGQPNRLAQVLRAGADAGAPGRAAPTDAPEYFGLDENASGKLEDYLSKDDVDNLRRVNKDSRRDTATLTLGDWRRDEDGDARGPGEWDNYGWTASLSRGRDATGTRVQYVATFDEYNAIRGNEGGVPLGIRFRIEGDEIEFERPEDSSTPFADGSAILNIPEWNLNGRYEFDYGSQSVRSLSDVEEEENGSRAFHIRIRQTIQSVDPRVHVSFGFACRVNENEGAGGAGGAGDDESDGSDAESEPSAHTANWYLRAVTLYRE